MSNKRLDLTRHASGHLMISLSTFHNGLMVRDQMITSGRNLADSVVENIFDSLTEIINVPTYVDLEHQAFQ